MSNSLQPHGLQPTRLLYPWDFPGRTSLEARTVKCLPTMWETRVQSLGREDPLEKGMATHSSILAWKIPWMEEPGSIQFMGLQRVRHNWATSLFNFTPRQEYWSGVPFPSPGDLPNPGIEPTSPAPAGRFFTSEPLGKPLSILYIISIVYTCQSPSLNSSHPLPFPPWYQYICSLCMCLYSCLIWNFFRLGPKELGDFSKYNLVTNLWHWSL